MPKKCVTSRQEATNKYIGGIAGGRNALYSCDMKRQKKIAREVDCGGEEGGNQVEKIGGKGEGGKVGSKGGRPRIRVSDEAKKKILQGVRLGIPVDRLIPIAIPSGSPGAWTNLMRLDPVFASDIQSAKAEGELDLVLRVSGSADGWQSSAWLLERTRGYVARQQLEHSGPGGKALTIAHQVLAAVQHGERA